MQSPDEWTRKVATYFDHSSEYWDEVYSDQSVKAQIYRNRMAVIGDWTRAIGPGAIAAEVGAGAGHFAVLLAQRGIQVAALDASEAMLTRVAQNASRAGVADLVVPLMSDAQKLELPSDTCDLVVAIGLLSWVENPATALAEMVRVAKPGGYVIVTMDNATSLVRLLDPGWRLSVRFLIYRIRTRRSRHLADLPLRLPAPMTWKKFNGLLHAAGLELIELEGVGFGPFAFLGRSILPNRIGLLIDRALQRVADSGRMRLKRAAVFHVALAVKPAAPSA